MLSVGLHWHLLCDQDSGTGTSETRSEVAVVIQMNVMHDLATTDFHMSAPGLTEVVLSATVHLSV